MNVLVACEESQAVCMAFRERGHRAFSADIQECSGGHPEWHIQGDVLPLINGNCVFQTADTHTHTQAGPWDLLIAFPPCTYMTNAGAVRMRVNGEIQEERFKKAMEAKEFFMRFYNADCQRIAIENPTPMSIVGLPECDQVIQPYQFGHEYSKRTCLWLHGLPQLRHTKYAGRHEPYVNGGCKDAHGNYRRYQGRAERDQRPRSKTFPGIAAAMAEQWGSAVDYFEPEQISMWEES